MSASAAFGLSVAAHEIIANPDAELGSVGVVVKLRNMNKAMNNAGVEDTYIYAGDSKIPFKEDGSFRKISLLTSNIKSMLYINSLLSMLRICGEST